MHENQDLRGRCSWEVSIGFYMAGLAYGVTAKKVNEKGYGLVGF